MDPPIILHFQVINPCQIGAAMLEGGYHVSSDMLCTTQEDDLTICDVCQLSFKCIFHASLWLWTFNGTMPMNSTLTPHK
jgi:hypothetical protein